MQSKKVKYILLGCIGIFVILLIMSLINKSLAASLINILFIIIIGFQLIADKVKISDGKRKVMINIFAALILVLLAFTAYHLFSVMHIIKIKGA